MPDRSGRAPAVLLAGVLGGSGVLHLVVPRVYEPLVPPVLGPARRWVYGSGVAELACALALAAVPTRRAGALASAALLVAVFPGNVWLAVRPARVPRTVAVARLPLQVPLVLWALSVHRSCTVTATNEPVSAGAPARA